MGKKFIIWLIVAVALILLGVAVFANAMNGLQWDFSKLSTEEYQTNEYALTQPFQNITVSTDTADVIFVKAIDGKATVTCHEHENEKHTVEIVDGTLMVQLSESKNWHDYIGIYTGTPKITVSLPGEQYGALSVRTSTGDVQIPKNFKFESMDVTGSTGDISSAASVSGNVQIETSAGDIHLQDISASTLKLTVSTGDIELANIHCQAVITQGDTGSISLENTAATENLSIARTTGDVELTGCNTAQLFVKTDTGDVELQRSDAGEIFIETNTGDVKGSLLTEKIFIANSDTGRIDVPKTTAGGKCEITTETGDVQIKIA